MDKFKVIKDKNNLIYHDKKRKRIITINMIDHKFKVTNEQDRKVWISKLDIDIVMDIRKTIFKKKE